MQHSLVVPVPFWMRSSPADIFKGFNPPAAAASSFFCLSLTEKSLSIVAYELYLPVVLR